jgi:succinate dehydrogenase / fumarate reductase membrane anchor subunit
MIGSTLFFVQRFSAVFLLAYTIWLTTFFIFNQPFEFSAWEQFTNQQTFLIFTSLVALITLLHAFIGLWTIGTDYFTQRTIGFLNLQVAQYANLIRGGYTLLFIIWGFLTVFFILFIIWS